MGGAEFYILNSIQDDGSIKLAEYHVTIGAFESINEYLKGFQKLKAKISFQKFIKNIRKYNKFIVLTKGDENEWSRFSKNVITIPNPQTFKINQKGLTLPREKLAVAVGRFEPEKQLDQLILIWKRVVDKYPDWKLILKGSGSQRDYYQKLIDDNNLKSNVLLEQPGVEMDAFYRNASMYLMASKFEGFSLVILEAMQSGLPVVAYNCKYGPSELISDEENGFLVPLNHSEDFLGKIFKLIEDEELRRTMSVKAIENAKKYEIEKVMDIWKNLFEKLHNDK
ncbi:glycosyltransferase [Chryseobacterium capnotolerans]|uniref:glycosyltransferase n=1 Tax=Chryseobacterium capnotolerans TaxID=2759528 RepID=UPI001E3C88A4|nr:glycosyltransferase [Chryseobacterium capnotolerans]UHO39171.1 glycosyltransferase [Chryseobacterium capnotolerans]